MTETHIMETVSSAPSSLEITLLISWVATGFLLYFFDHKTKGTWMQGMSLFWLYMALSLIFEFVLTIVILIARYS